VKESVREWTLTLPKELPFWELESRWISECVESDCKGQNPKAQGVLYIIGKLLMRATTLFQTSSQSEVCTQSYGAPKLRESQLWQFRNSHLGVPGQNAIWMWASWRGTVYTIRGKVAASPKSGPWWVLWVRVCSWFILTPKVFKLCTNHLMLVLCRPVWVVDACHSS